MHGDRLPRLALRVVPWAVAWFLVLLGGSLEGCGGSAQMVSLSWRFADGRSCEDAGAAVVQLFGDPNRPPILRARCRDGLSPASVAVLAPPGASLVALSADGGALYRGDLDAAAAVGTLVVTLYAAAAR